MLLRGPQLEPKALPTTKLFNRPAKALNTSTVSIDLTSTGTTTLFTPDAADSVHIVGVWLEALTVDTVTGNPKVSVGTEGSTTNIFADTELVDLNQIGEVFMFWQIGGKGVMSTGSQIQLQVNTAATASALSVEAHVVGYIL